MYHGKAGITCQAFQTGDVLNSVLHMYVYNVCPHYIIKLTRPSHYFLLTLKKLSRSGYEVTHTKCMYYSQCALYLLGLVSWFQFLSHYSNGLVPSLNKKSNVRSVAVATQKKSRRSSQSTTQCLRKTSTSNPHTGSGQRSSPPLSSSPQWCVWVLWYGAYMYMYMQAWVGHAPTHLKKKKIYMSV